MAEQRPDAHRVLLSLAEQRPSLELSTVEVCFLAALQLRSRQGTLSSFREDELVDVFDEVSRAVAERADAPRKSSSHAIRRLREQRMLARIDGAGVVRAGEYALTRLASAIVEFFLEDEALTRDSLVVLTRTLVTSLLTVQEAARTADSDERWQDAVVAPLRVTLRELASGIERRQRGFDLQQESLRTQISGLLQADWFGAIDRCQSLLELTSKTLTELNEVLMRDTVELYSALEELQELAADAGQAAAEAQARELFEQVDRIVTWGSQRQAAWSEYYQYVHRYLRDVVRLDPTRALTHRLREQLAAGGARTYGLAVADAPTIRLLREVLPPLEQPPVRRPRKERETPLEALPVEDPDAELKSRVQESLRAGARSLQVVTSAALAELPAERRFAAAGRVAQLVAEQGAADASADRPWVSVDDALAIEEWHIRETGADG